MKLDIDEFAEDLVQAVHSRAREAGMLFADAFFEVVTEHLVDAGELDEAQRAFFDSGRGVRVDGYGGDPRESDRKLTLVAMDPIPESDAGNLTQTEMDKMFKRLEKFIDQALSGVIQVSLDPSTEAWGLADLISARWHEVETVRLIILTNRPLSSRIDRKDAGEIDGIPVTYGVWDITRIHRFIESGAEREALEIDFIEEFGRGIPAISANVTDAGYQAYLAVIPGEDLAAVYDRWGARLLEQNVRVFLQARSKVNKGIRTTLESEPHMFLAYNNGIAATAEDVTLEQTEAGLRITRARNLQIVNGGQTTASIHRASKSEDLSHVFVQMKLAVIVPEEVEDVVPRISEYANSQNRVSQADFFSNHPFHVQVENFSRRVWAEASDGQFAQTKWFYERARGQYLDAQANLTRSEKRQFKETYPPSQKFTKTDLAKFLNVWRQIPDTVSKGAQKNFANFAEWVAKEWGDKNNVTGGEKFDERFYHHTIAKAIVFRTTERLVSAADWYEGGYRANIVAYSIAKLSAEYERADLRPDFDLIWKRQAVPAEMERSLRRIGELVSEVLVHPPLGIANITEWAKKKACWERVRDMRIDDLPLQSAGITRTEENAKKSAARRDYKVVAGIEAQTFVFRAGGAFWQSILEWGSSRKALSMKERGILEVCSQMETTGRIPTEKQCPIAIQALLRLTDEEGCPLGREVLRDSPFG